MLLAIDTSTRAIGVALHNGNQVLNETMWVSRDFHTVELAPAVAEILSKSKLTFFDLDALAVAIGPGSFTGLRIGLALAKGLSLANRLPLMGVPTLDILAVAQPTQFGHLVAVLQAGRGRLAASWYQVQNGVWKSEGAIEVLTPLELNKRILKPTLICGELSEEAKSLLGRKHKNVILASPAQSVRRPAYLAELGWERWKAGKVDDPAILSPIYLHHREPIPG